MENEKNNGTGKNIVIVILSVLLLIAGGYLGYDKFLKSDKEQKNIIENNTTKNSTEVDSSISNHDSNITTNELNSYELFSRNLKNEILNWKISSYSVRDSEYNGILYKVILTNKMSLVINFTEPKYQQKYGEIKIADNVIGFTVAQSGPGGYQNIYFINEDGTVGYAIPWEFLNGDKENVPVTNPLSNLKNIVSIIQVSYQDRGYMQEPTFLDINGNLIQKVFSAWD